MRTLGLCHYVSCKMIPHLSPAYNMAGGGEDTPSVLLYGTEVY